MTGMNAGTHEPEAVRIEAIEPRLVKFFDTRLRNVVDGADLVRPHRPRGLHKIKQVDVMDVRRREGTTWPAHPTAARVAETHGNIIAQLLLAVSEGEHEVDPLVRQRFVDRALAGIVAAVPVKIVDGLDDPDRLMTD